MKKHPYPGWTKSSVAVAALMLPAIAFAQAEQPAEEQYSGDIVVTATRQSESLSKVPLSVSAFSQEKLDSRGVRDFADVIRQTPGVVFEATNTTTNISIRGINSTAGAATTGVYIDDTPIQIRALGYSGGNTYPVIFDLERVEVLRGPQGTLFGAGSEGGTIRFISPQPSTTKSSGYARTEFAMTEDGGPSYEAGLALGVPLIQDKLGVRVSGYYRRDGGWIDRVRFENKGVVADDSNYQNSYVGRIAFTWEPTPELKITPSIAYQKVYTNDSPETWDNVRADPSVPDAQFSNYDKGEFLNGNRVPESGRDRFYLPTLNVQYAFGPVDLTAIASYFDRKQTFRSDYTLFDQSLFTGITLPIFPNQQGFSDFVNTQKITTGEIRLASSDRDAALTWQVGGFYQKAKQISIQQVDDPFLFQYAPFLVGIFPPLVNGRLIYDQSTSSKDEQIAAFGQVNFKPVDRLTLTVGLRYGQTKFNINSFAQGPVVGPAVTDVGRQKEKPFTPKFGAEFQVTPSTLVYASASKGFRPGGYNPQVGVPCQASDLDPLGYPNGRPLTYKSDSVWSYELGLKTRTGRFSAQGSVYQIDWKNIQQVVGLGGCGFQFTANLGSARSRGFDLQLDYRLTDDFSVQAEVGYTNAKFLDTFFGGPLATVPLVTKGNHVVSPPWTVSVHGQYDLSLRDHHDSYIRADFDYRSRQSSLTPGIDPRNGGSDPTLTNAPALKALSMRAGYRINGIDLSLFVNNLLDQAVWQGRRARDNNNATIYKSYVVRPRTFGATIAYRF
ncbi:TonB-dependent receptor [Sphingomonas sp. C8-2]|nr:TonB-dependent receptor [Sphingomonas sp. C8-2]